MTMVRSIRCWATRTKCRRQVAGRMAMLVLWWLGVATGLPAQQPPVHYVHQGVMPPGAIGGRQLQRGGPLPGFFQPVEIKAPPGALVSLAVANQFDEAAAGTAKGRLSHRRRVPAPRDQHPAVRSAGSVSRRSKSSTASTRRPISNAVSPSPSTSARTICSWPSTASSSPA